jgi:hypothetical protein
MRNGYTKTETLLAILAAAALVLLIATAASAKSDHHNVTCVDETGAPVTLECAQGDTTVVCPNVQIPACPPAPACPDITIQSRVLRCARVKALKNGVTIGRRCLLVTEGTQQ